MLQRLKDLIINAKDVQPCYPGSLADKRLAPYERRRIACRWLQQFQVSNIQFLRNCNYAKVCAERSVTLLIYTFPRSQNEFLQVEFAIRHTWRILGRLHTVVVADKPNADLERLKSEWSDDIEIQYEPSLTPGTTRPMSVDCITRLFTRFSTEYCLIIQDDGFPMRDNLHEFIGTHDYLGCSTYRDIRKPLQWLIECRKHFILNGGFTLRSRKICELASRTYAQCRLATPEGSSNHIEDVFYTVYARKFKSYERQVSFPSLAFARRFSVSNLFGEIDIHKVTPMPFGFHDVTTAVQYIPEFVKMGYQIEKLP